MRKAVLLGVFFFSAAVGYGQQPSPTPPPQPPSAEYHAVGETALPLKPTASQPQSLPTQVLLHVKMIEVSRTQAKRLGHDLAKLDVASSGKGSGVASARTGVCYLAIDNRQVLESLQTLERDKAAKVLAAPTLVALSGRAAMLQIGGEVPIWRLRPDGSVEQTFRPYGLEAEFLPVVLADARIRCEVRFAKTEIDPTRSVQIAGHTNPGLRTRRVDTGVELKSGQTLIVGGLVEKRPASASANAPGSGAAKTAENEEFETFLLATPEITRGDLPSGVRTARRAATPPGPARPGAGGE